MDKNINKEYLYTIFNAWMVTKTRILYRIEKLTDPNALQQDILKAWLREKSCYTNGSLAKPPFRHLRN